MSFAKNYKSTVIPCLSYKNAPTAIEWLCLAFGFEKQAVYNGPDGSIVHAQLSFGNGMLMVSPIVEGTPYSSLIRQPSDIGAETQSPCLIVSDCDAVYATAKAAGADIVIDIVLDIQDQDYGGRAFTCRDPERHLWNVGSYSPWKPVSA